MACSRYFLLIAVALAGWSSCVAEELAAESNNRQPRTLHKKKCQKFGLCNSFYGGQGGHGYQNGYNQGGVPINIAISQSQSSANGADGGHADGHFPNNYQYNQHGQGGYNQGYGGYNQGYGGYNQGYGGYNQGYGGYNQGYGGYNKYRPGYGNGIGSNNNQFNGNYYSGGAVLGQTGGGGYGFQKPFGQYYDEDGNDSNEDDYGDYGFGRSASASASAVAKSAA